MKEPEEIATWIRRTYPELIEQTVAAREDVAGAWEGTATEDRGLVVPPLERELEARGLLSAYVELLDALRARTPYGEDQSFVAAPPYVVVTSCGPLLRLTGRTQRLLVRFELFTVEPGPRYRTRRCTGDGVVAVYRQRTDREFT